MSAPPGFPTFIPPPLPPGWTEHPAPNGQPYYYHAATNQSTYTRPIPTGPFPGMLPFMPPAGAVIPGTKEKKKKEKPLLKTPVPGTQWLKVTTTEGNVFWTHKERKESVWTVPDEIKDKVAELEREEKLKQEEEHLEKERKEREEKEQLEEAKKLTEREEVERVREELRDVVAAGKRKASAEPAEDTDKAGSKKARIQDEEEKDVTHEGKEGTAELAAAAEEKANLVVPMTTADGEESTKPPKDEDGKISFAVPDRVDLSIEEAKALFKTLLTEKNINPLHPWDTSLPLFISDPRYVLLPSVSARREAFDEYCRDAARAQRAAKAAALKEEAMRAAIAGLDKDKEAYTRLLKEEVTSTRTSWTDFRRKWKKDRRFFGWAGEREREKAFREWIKELAEVKKKQAEKAEKEFFQLLKEYKEIKPGDEWKEVKRKIDTKDPRYDAVGSSSLREELFGTYVKVLAQKNLSSASKIDAEDGQIVADQDLDDQAYHDARRKERTEHSLREREEKIRREREGIQKEIGRTRGTLGREEGEREFMTLLTDAVRAPQAKWDVVAPALSIDPRFVLSALPLSVQKELFSKHVMRLREKYTKGLHTLFAAHVPGLNTQWQNVEQDARKAIHRSLPASKLGLAGPESDADYDFDDDNLSRRKRRKEDAELEAEFEKWQRMRNNEARQAFDAMLGENAFLEFWGRMSKAGGAGTEGGVPVDDEEEEDGEGGGGKADLKKLAKSVDIDEVAKVLKGDSRWSAFDHVPDQRERWLKDYMERLAAPKLSVHIPDKDRS